MKKNDFDDPNLGLDEQEIRNFRWSRAIAAAAFPNDPYIQKRCGLESAVTLAGLQRADGQTRGNVYIPHEVLTRDMTVGTAADGGNLVATDLHGNRFIDHLRNQTVVFEAGATVISGLVGNSAFPRLTDGNNVFWVSENGAVTEDQPTFDQVALTPKTVGAYTEISRRLLLQSTVDAEKILVRSIARDIAVEIDRVAINGSGTSNQPLGLLGTSGIGDVAGGDNGLAPDRSHILGLESDIAIANALSGRMSYITNAMAVAKLKQTTLDAGSGRFLLEGAMGANGGHGLTMNGYRALMSNNVPSNLTKGTASGICSAIIFGNFEDLVIGLWSGLDIQVNPYSLDTTGAVRVTAFQDLDIAVTRPASFSAMQDALTT